jgi:hypothetical protein
MTTNTTLAKSTSVRDLSEIFSLHKDPTFKVAAIIAVHSAGVAAAAAYYIEGKLIKTEINYEKARTSGKSPENLQQMHQTIQDLQAELKQIVAAAEESDEEATNAVAAAAKATAAEAKEAILTADSVIADADVAIAVAIAKDVATHQSEISLDAIENSIEIGAADADADAAIAAADAAVDAAKDMEFQVSEAKLAAETHIEKVMSSSRNAIKSSEFASANYSPDDDGIEKNIHKSELPDRLQLLRHELFLSNKLFHTTWTLFTKSHHGLVDAIKGLFGEWGDTA